MYHARSRSVSSVSAVPRCGGNSGVFLRPVTDQPANGTALLFQTDINYSAKRSAAGCRVSLCAAIFSGMSVIQPVILPAALSQESIPARHDHTATHRFPTDRMPSRAIASASMVITSGVPRCHLFRGLKISGETDVLPPHFPNSLLPESREELLHRPVV